MSHLGPLISPLIDGQLPAAKAERAMAHVAACAQCRAEVAEERAWRSAARSAGDARPSEDLTARLLALQIPGQSPGPVGPSLDTPSLAASARRPTGTAHPLRTRVLTGAVASLGVFALALFVLGEQPRRVDDLAPLMDAGGALSGATNGPAPPGAQASDDRSRTDWIIESGWAAPDELPAGMVIQAVGLLPPAPETGEILQVTIGTPGSGQQVMVLEQHGMLDPAMLAPLEPTRVGEHTVYLVSGEWWVVQCEDSVVVVSSGSDPDAAHEFIEHLPAGGGTVVDRLTTTLSDLIPTF
ncbi:anti-sigma factor family protein [Occultella kanbiaonis]|uniref:anti-sigma factor family protein n=1 Tax=Occultella kanbiaonis TaxID=2675754 RepID=UPI00143D100C|nr:zf-HC2 domain-containing protein [Occultella kanbiaonis]